jgi:uroporphyrin-III C-methyltransferase/precorrin-2 dehydrogenase/sirohydrochlorin ferrochelatase
MVLPIFFKTQHLPCLVIGGGSVASRKVDILLSASCKVTVVAPALHDRIRFAVDRGLIAWHPRTYVPGDCAGFHLVIAATPHRETNREVYLEATGLGIPVNVVDDPESCTVIFGAVWTDGPLTISVGTGGTAPFMAAAIRDQVAKAADGMGAWVEAAGRFRAAVRARIDDPVERERLYRLFVSRFSAGCPTRFPENLELESWVAWLDQAHPTS